MALIFNNWIFHNNDDENNVIYERRPYHIPERATINSWDEVEFYRRFRLTKRTFVEVLHLIGHDLQHPYPRPRYISEEQQLLILLRFLACGNMQVTVADVVHVSPTSVCRVLPKVCDALLRHLPNYVRMPSSAEELRTAAVAFYGVAQFPRTIGAIDCTHVKIQSPGGQLSEAFRNRKGWFSLNVQTISSVNLKVLNIVARWAGSVHDQTIFQNSNVRREFEEGRYGQYILVGDSGYANTSYLATPFTASNPDIANNRNMQVYQSRIIRTRNVVERQYGVIKRRFPILAYGMRISIETAQKIIACCAILHNICIDRGEINPPQNVDDQERLRLMLEETEIARDPISVSSLHYNRRTARDEILQVLH